MRVVSVDQMRALEAAAFAAGVSEEQLQLRAARAVAEIVARRAPPGEAVALVGPGNNGRDAYLAVRNLLPLGWQGGVYLTPHSAVAEEELRGFARAGGRLSWHSDSSGGLALEASLTHATVVLDGLLGIGARGAPRAPLSETIETLNELRAKSPKQFDVVSVDVPSGVDADTGLAPGPAVVADCTVVLGAVKQGLLTASAARHTGQFLFADIGLEDGPAGAPSLIIPESVRGYVPPAAPDAHKGSLGRLLVLAGSHPYVGAAALVCAAAVRA